MDPKQVIVVVVAFAVLLAMVWNFVRKQRTIKPRERFGPEYDLAISETGAQRAEAALLEREKRVGHLPLRELSTEEFENFQTEWQTVQSHFVDDPGTAVGKAHLLVDRLVQARGYPATDFEQRAADISVAHPRSVSNYRTAYQIAEQSRQGKAGTEDLRNALLSYRSLFDELSIPKREVA